MSETTTETSQETASDTAVLTDQTTVTETGADLPTQTEATPVATEATTEQSTETTPPKAKQGDRRFAQVTARLATESAAREAAERRAEAAEALLNANKTEETPAEAPRLTAEDVRREAARQVAEQTLNTRLAKIDTEGKKALGAAAWETAKGTMTALGATGNQTFLQALAEAEVPEKIFAHYAEDADGLVELLNKSPTAMAAAIGRLDAKLAAPPPPAPVRPLSAAPRPAVPIQPAAVLAEIDPFGPDQEKLSMAEWNASFEKSDLGKKLLRPRAGR